VLVDTASTRSTFRPLELSLEAAGARLTNDGAAWYRVSAGGGSMVSTGTVRVDDQVQPVTDAALDCGDGREVQRPAGPTEEPSPSDEPSPTDLPSPTATPSVTPTPPAGTDDDDDGTGDDDDNPPPGQPGDPVPPVTRPPTTPPTVPPTSPADDNEPPSITWVRDPGGTIRQDTGEGTPCPSDFNTAAFPVVSVTDDRDPDQAIKVTVLWSGFASGSDAMSWDGDFFGRVGPVPYSGTPNRGGTLSITVIAQDTDGAENKISGTNIAVAPCSPQEPPS
jgi:hypothetical protein